MARRGCPSEFRSGVLDLVEGGSKVADVAADLEISEQTIYSWRRQARIDAVGVSRCPYLPDVLITPLEIPSRRSGNA